MDSFTTTIIGMHIFTIEFNVFYLFADFQVGNKIGEKRFIHRKYICKTVSKIGPFDLNLDIKWYTI